MADAGAALQAPFRRDPRTSVTLVVEYEGADVLDCTENLSQGGTFVLTNRPLPIGTEVHLVLSLPGLLEAIAVSGVVRWCQRDDQPGVGIEFLDGAPRSRLAALLERVAAAGGEAALCSVPSQ